MEIVVVKGEAGERERMWVTRTDGSTDQVPINMVHDLPHLVVESAFGLRFGFWGLIDAGAFGAEIRAARARDDTRAKDGRSGILMGRPHQSPVAQREGLDELVVEHADELIAGKALTNAFRGPSNTPADVRARLAPAAAASAVVRAAFDDLSDERIEQIAAALAEHDNRWAALPPGGKMQLRWPLAQSDR
jgi:hypothetical protein